MIDDSKVNMNQTSPRGVRVTVPYHVEQICYYIEKNPSQTSLS